VNTKIAKVAKAAEQSPVFVRDGLSAMDLRAVRELKTHLQETVPLHRLIVFGSRARGDADPESDLDVLVELNHADLRARKLVTEGAWEVSLRNSMVIMPVTVDRSEWETGVQKSSLLARAIAMEGVEV
jgi:predicted nucleotidyltransferase